MSWDIFVQDIPDGIRSVADIDAGFRPGAVGTRAEVLAAIQAVFPFADDSDPTWVRVDKPGIAMEISLGKDDPVRGFAFHVHGGELAVPAIAEILDRLGARAFDPGNSNGLFDPGTAEGSLERWQEFRAAHCR